jgi:hypothetical protein
MKLGSVLIGLAAIAGIALLETSKDEYSENSDYIPMNDDDDDYLYYNNNLNEYEDDDDEDDYYEDEDEEDEEDEDEDNDYGYVKYEYVYHPQYSIHENKIHKLSYDAPEYSQKIVISLKHCPYCLSNYPYSESSCPNCNAKDYEHKCNKCFKYYKGATCPFCTSKEPAKEQDSPVKKKSKAGLIVLGIIVFYIVYFALIFPNL